MKCKQHPYEPAVGVCASCLRERLLALIAAQNEAAAAAGHHYQAPPPAVAPPPPLLFPQSVSPYVAPHRRSDTSLHHHLQRFFSTPQVGPTFEASVSARAASRKIPLFSSLFGHRRSLESDRPSKSGSWISGLIRRHRKKPHCDTASPGRRWCSDDRGMSPTRGDESGCSSEHATVASPAWWRRSSASGTPMRRSATSGFAVCLSPLVRPCPSGGRRCGGAEVVGVSGELRVLPSPRHNRHGSLGGPVLGPNRSRKLADLGRFK